MAEDQESSISALVLSHPPRRHAPGAAKRMLSNAELDRLIAEFERILSRTGSCDKEPIAAKRFRVCLLPEFGRTNALLLQEGGLTEAREETASAMWDGACDSDARALHEGRNDGGPECAGMEQPTRLRS
jgi:hypothetical protein